VIDPRRQHARLAVFLVGMLALNFPLLAAVDAVAIGTQPITPAYLFVVWLVVILAGALVNLRGSD